MCIQWCCKNCPGTPTELNHRWARQRCNEYFIARSKNHETADCPIGPWELRRAYHRHPYRGPQICDDCKGASRKDKKLVQSARQKANAAWDQFYKGVVDLGELEIPETSHGNAHGLFQKGRVDHMMSNWETFREANVHLPAHQFEHERADSSAAFNDVVPDGRGCARQPSKLTSSFEKRMSEEDSGQVDPTLMEDISRSQHQPPHCDCVSSAYGWNQYISPCAISIRRKPNSTIDRPDITTAGQTASRCAIQLANCEHNIVSDTRADTGMNKQDTPNVEQASPSATHRHHQHLYLPLSKLCDRSATVEKRDAPQEPDRGQLHRSPTATARLPPSQPIRRRPWDL